MAMLNNQMVASYNIIFPLNIWIFSEHLDA